MKISPKKYFLVVILSFSILLFGFQLSNKFDSDWLVSLGIIASYIVASLPMLYVNFDFHESKSILRINVSSLILISIGITGLFLLLDWQYHIIIAILLKRDYVDVMNYNISFLIIFKSILIYPLVEELFFRRIIAEMIYRGSGFYGSLFLSSTLFGLIHWNTDTSILTSFIAGIILGYIYLKSSNIWLSVFAHSFFNFLVLFVTPTLFDYVLGITEYWIFGMFVALSISLIVIMIFGLNLIKEKEIKLEANEFTSR